MSVINIQNNLNEDSQLHINVDGDQTQMQESKNLLSQMKQMQKDQDHENLDSTQTKQLASELDKTLKSVTVGGKANSGENSTSPSKSKSKPAYLQSLNESEKQANFKIIEKMNKKISFLKNPRFKVNKAPIIMTDAFKNQNTHEIETMKKTSFRVEPTILNFQDYQVNSCYEMNLKVTNISSVSKRIKFIPPLTENFTVKTFKYPSNVKGDIAPGMSLLMTVVFQAPSFADFDDFVTFVTEENSFKIPMKARRNPPQITLTNPMDCLNSWLGDRVDMAFRCINSGGDGGFKFFCEKDEDDSRQTDPDTIRIGSFTLTPSEFYLYSGSAIDIYVSFNPEREGKLEENLILACDNQTSEFYKLTGYGAMMDLDVIAVDGKEVNFKVNPFQTIYFENTNPTSENKKIIRVKNSSPLMVPFHWSIYRQKNQQKITLENEDIHYRIQPSQGKILGGEYLDFQLFFCPIHAEPYLEFADLIIEDIPITSVRNPPEGLKNFAQANTIKNSKVPMPTYVGSNTQFLSIPMIQFDLKGQGNSCQIEVTPSLCLFEGDCFINYQYIKDIKLKKISEGKVKYQLKLEEKSKKSFDIDIIAQGKSIKKSNGVLNGIIDSSENDINLQIQVTSAEKGEYSAYFYIEIEDGSPVSFQVICNFIGPIVQCLNPIIDFGLLKVNSTEHHEIEFQNMSPIPTEILIKNSTNMRLDFFNKISVNQNKGGNQSSSASLIYDKPMLTKKGNQIIIDEYNLILKPNEKFKALISIKTTKPEKVEEYFEIMVKEGASQFFQVHSDIQRPQVQLNRLAINLGKVYAGVTEYINPQSKHQKSSLVLKNYGNLPAFFKWDQKNDPDVCVYKFEPASGVIQPRQELKIKMTITFFKGGNLNELFVCDIQDIELPIGVEVYADAFGLNVSYESQEDQNTELNSTKSSQILKKSDVKTSELQVLNFPNCIINKTSSQRFILKNLSGIKSHFDFQSLTYFPKEHVAPREKSELEKAKEEAEARARQKIEEEQNSSKGSTKNKKKVGFMNTGGLGSQGGMSDGSQLRVRPILSDEHEQTQKFSSAVGETFTKTKQLEKEQNFYLSNNKGLAIVFTPNTGDLPPNSEIPILVTIYNNVCGKFNDVIVSNVKGLPQVQFPVNILINGSPIRIPANQVGLNYNTIPPTLPMPTVIARSKPITKTFTIKNTGIKSLEIKWNIYDLENLIGTGIKLQTQQIEEEKEQKRAQIQEIEPDEEIHKEQQDNETAINQSQITPGIQNQSQVAPLSNQNTSQISQLQPTYPEDNQQETIEQSQEQSLQLNLHQTEFIPLSLEEQLLQHQPSSDSAFKIKPAQVVVGARTTCLFTVTFDPSKGSGQFRSVVLATPELSSDELEIENGVNQNQSNNDELEPKINIKGNLGIISLNLQALTIDPHLSIDKKLKMDGSNHLRIKYWSLSNDQDAPSKVQKLTFNNESKADMTFNLNLNGPFQIVKTKTNSGAVHPLAQQQNKQQSTKSLLAAGKSTSKVLKEKVETMFCLQPLKIIEVHIKFMAPPVNDTTEWPMTIFNERSGEFIIHFSNGDQQKLFLDGILMRPKICILTDYISKNDYAVDELDFGKINVEKSRTIHIYLSNQTEVTAKWSLNYIKFPKKSQLGHNTTTQWEQENQEKIDDAEVFEFSVTTGLLKGKSLPLRKVPEGLLVPPVPKDAEEQKYLPQKIYIKFKPKQNVLYKSKFRFLTEQGMACDIILKGRGSYEENHD